MKKIDFNRDIEECRFDIIGGAPLRESDEW